MAAKIAMAQAEAIRPGAIRTIATPGLRGNVQALGPRAALREVLPLVVDSAAAHHRQDQVIMQQGPPRQKLLQETLHQGLRVAIKTAWRLPVLGRLGEALLVAVLGPDQVQVQVRVVR